MVLLHAVELNWLSLTVSITGGFQAAKWDQGHFKHYFESYP